MVKSKFSFWVYAQLFFVLFCACILAWLVYYYGLTGKNNPTSSHIMGFVLIFILLSCVVYSLSRKLSSIKIDGKTIYIRTFFKKTTLTDKEIVSIDLFSKSNLFFLMGNIPLTTKIEITDGQKIMLPDPFYSNYEQIKETLSQNFKEKITPDQNELKFTSFTGSLHQAPEKIAGNPYTSFNTFMAVGFVLFMIFLGLSPHQVSNREVLQISVPISILVCFALGIQMNYFIISDEEIIVRNHYFFWFRKTYKVQDIVAVSFEQPFRSSQGFRIVTNNFKSRRYRAGSLRTKHWVTLRDKIEALQITIAK